ncbi:MAG TPA: hypothetical protein VIT85_08865 [Solirubrobacterales bacterium]
MGSRLRAATLAAVCAALAAAILAPSAPAKTIAPKVYDGVYPAASFDGTGSVGAPSPFFGNGANHVAVDEETGNVYVGSPSASRLYKFDASGNPLPFTEVAPNTALEQSFESGELFVDNSGGPHQGRIYAISYDFEKGQTNVAAYEPSGAPAPNFPFPLFTSAGEVAPDGSLWLVNTSTEKVEQFDSTTAAPTGKSINAPLPFRLAIDSRNYFYVSSFPSGLIKKYDAAGQFQELIDTESGSGYADLAVDRSNDHFFAGYESQFFEYDENGIYLSAFGGPEGAYPGLSGSRALAVNGGSGKIYVNNNTFPPTIDRFAPAGTVIVPDAATGGALPEGNEATLNAIVNPDGVDTTDCHFDWGPTRAYAGPDVPCNEGDVLGGDGDTPVSATLSELSKGTTYHYRISTKNANDRVVLGKDRTFVAQGIPTVSGEFASKVNSDGARINAVIDPEGGPTTFHIEYGTDASYGSVAPIPDVRVLGYTTEAQAVTVDIGSLEPETEYHYKVVATNTAGSGESGEDHTFITFPAAGTDGEGCPNLLERQQSGSAHLLDCRAYELVSAANLGGYDVESAIVPGQKPYVGFPRATDRVLYGMHNGGIPGSGSPTNKGVDPYLATRGEAGWTTKYIGIPADGTPSTAPFASPLLGAADDLQTFAFGGDGSCSPCFDDGTAGIPLRGPDGKLVQAMEGSQDPADPRRPDGLVLKSLSADGTHLVFGSADQFESDGNNNGDVSIYDRDLTTGQTQVVSKDPDGANLSCLQGAGTCHSPGNKAGIAALDVSADGSRIVVAQRVSTDTKGNHYWRPFMHVGTSPETIELAPGSSSGVHFDGMTADGSKVFMTTTDKLLPAEDTDTSADIYVADVGPSSATLSLVSVDSSGAPINDDGCTPANEPNTWNTAVGDGKCGALAFAGGAGLATDSGAFYFLSPEQLDGSEGEADEANLYRVESGGDPQFVAVLDSSLDKPEAGRLPHELDDQELVTGLENPESLAVDQRNGDFYVLERFNGFGPSSISRYDSSGAPKAFTDAEVYLSGNAIVDVESWYFAGRDQIAIDSHVGSPLEGAIYSTSSFGSRVMVYANEGEKIGEIPAIGGNEVCGVAVDQSTGVLYIAELGFGGTQTRVRRFEPISNSVPIDAADYEETRITTVDGSGCSIAVDAGKRIYLSSTSSDIFENGPTRKYFASKFVPVSLTVEGVPITPRSMKTTALATDPANGDVFVDTGDRVVRYDSAGKLTQTFGLGDIGTGSRGVAIDSERGYAYVSDSSAGKVVRYRAPLPPKRPVDNPAITHAADQAGVHSFGDFQVTPDGHYAAFASVQPLTGFDAFGQPNVFRYDAQADEIECASCLATNERPNGASGLASHGLSLADNGKLFFDSYKALVLRDTDDVKDAYELSDGEVQLISTGASQFDSGLLGASADSKDVFFFTRDSLSPLDKNGSVMRIYDARENGGRFIIPPPPQCAASDECHGPGSAVPANPPISSLAGTEAKAPKPIKCRKGYVKKHGKCVKKKKKTKKKKAKRGGRASR